MGGGGGEATKDMLASNPPVEDASAAAQESPSPQKRKSRLSLRGSFRLSRRLSKSMDNVSTIPADEVAAGTADPEVSKKIASRVKRLFTNSLRLKRTPSRSGAAAREDKLVERAKNLAHQDSFFDTPPPPSMAVPPAIRMETNDGTVLWKVKMDLEYVETEVPECSMLAMDTLEMQATRSYAIMAIPQHLPRITRGMLTESESSRRSSSMGGLLRLFSKSKSDFTNSALDPSQVARRSTTGRSRTKSRSSASSAASGEDGPRVFGRPLDELIANDRKQFRLYDLQIPYLCEVTINYIREHGIRTAGVFRVSGSAKRTRQLNEAFEDGETPSLDAATPADVTSVLKYFLRSMPDGLLTSALYEAFLEIDDISESAEQLLLLRLLISMLPHQNRKLLYSLMQLMGEIAAVASEPDSSQMTSRNLALVLAPSILRSNFEGGKGRQVRSKSMEHRQTAGQPELSSAASEQVTRENAACSVVQMLIDYSEHVFMIPPEVRDLVLQHQMRDTPNVTVTILKTIYNTAINAEGSIATSAPIPIPLHHIMDCSSSSLAKLSLPPCNTANTTTSSLSPPPHSSPLRVEGSASPSVFFRSSLSEGCGFTASPAGDTSTIAIDPHSLPFGDPDDSFHDTAGSAVPSPLLSPAQPTTDHFPEPPSPTRRVSQESRSSASTSSVSEPSRLPRSGQTTRGSSRPSTPSSLHIESSTGGRGATYQHHTTVVDEPGYNWGEIFAMSDDMLRILREAWNAATVRSSPALLAQPEQHHKQCSNSKGTVIDDFSVSYCSETNTPSVVYHTAYGPRDGVVSQKLREQLKLRHRQQQYKQQQQQSTSSVSSAATHRTRRASAASTRTLSNPPTAPATRRASEDLMPVVSQPSVPATRTASTASLHHPARPRRASRPSSGDCTAAPVHKRPSQGDLHFAHSSQPANAVHRQMSRDRVVRRVSATRLTRKPSHVLLFVSDSGTMV
eukprot:m.190525 g.190525  ORF g.190525 m.190525 type:complete len:962 (-) comp14820_c0_seq2:1112-3997(-)